MRILIFSLIVFSQLSFGKSAYQAYRMPSSGNVPGWGTIFRQTLPSVGQQISSSSGVFSHNNNTPTDVTNLSVSITTTGRPVFIGMISDGSGNDSNVIATENPGTSPDCNLYFLRSGTIISRSNMGGTTTGTTVSQIKIPVSASWIIDVPAAGTYTYKVQAATNGGGNETLNVNYAKLIAYEL